MNIYVGNLSRDVTEEALKQAFEEYGQVASANIIKDRFTGESRGFGFVEMSSKTEAEAAIAALDGHELGDRAIRVNEAYAKSPGRRPGGGGGGGGGGRGRRGGSGRDRGSRGPRDRY